MAPSHRMDRVAFFQSLSGRSEDDLKTLRSGSDELLERIFRHGAVNGPESWFMRARLEQVRGRMAEAHGLMRQCLAKCPGSTTFQTYIWEIGA